MRKRLFPIGFFFMITTSSICYAVSEQPSIINYYLNPKFWQIIQWDQADKSDLWKSEKWTDLGTKLDDGRVISKTTTFPIADIELTAKLFHESEQKNKKFSTVIFCDSNSINCEKLIGEFIKKFGAPLINDATVYLLKFSETNWVKMHDVRYQWDIGTTRIDGWILGTNNYDDEQNKTEKQTFSIKFSNIQTTKKMTNKFALRCSRRYEATDINLPARDLDDLVLWVNPYTNTLSYPNNLNMGKDIKIGEETIQFTIVYIQKTEVQYRIDRISGGLNGNVKVDGKSVAKITGKCEKLEELKPKF